MSVKVIKKIAMSIVLSSVFVCTSATMSEYETNKPQALKDPIAKLQTNLSEQNEKMRLESLEKTMLEGLESLEKTMLESLEKMMLESSENLEKTMLESLEKRTKEAIKTIAKIREERSSPPMEAGLTIAATASGVFQLFTLVREKIGLEKIKQHHDLRAILESLFGLSLDRI